MTRMIFAAVFALTPLVFGLLPAAAYEAPWCAVLGMGKGVYWDCQYATFEACRPNVLQAIADGAIPTRTLSHRMRQRKAGTTTQGT
jgi:hypothetical protein